MTPEQKQRIRKKLYVVNEYGIEHQNPACRLEPAEVELLADQYEIRTDVHRMCINCQGRQVLKYEGKKHPKTGEAEDRFRIRCSFIPDRIPGASVQALNELINNGMNRERAELLVKSAVDPAAWANLMFGFEDPTEEQLAEERRIPDGRKKRQPLWYLRDYQKEQLRCTSERLVVREGRRSGKTFAMALKLLYLAFNREEQRGRDAEGNPVIRGPSIMVVTPYQAQIRNIFDELENLLKRNVDLQKAVTTGGGGSLYVKTPFFRMEFENGAKISGFVSGVGTKADGSGGGVMRGQTASIIYLDEMDMIPDEILDKAVLPILISYPDTMLLATSTPIGKKGRFYRWAMEDPSFKEDYLPSTVLPQWDAQKEMIENENSEEAFRAEYLAEFIDGGYGVFKSSLVHQARQDYTYMDTQNPQWWLEFCQVRDPTKLICSMGIDWNKNAGTEFVVTAFDPIMGRFIVVDAVNMPASKFSALKWKEEVVRLNYKWRPMYIYADAGYGHTIVEDLQLHAHRLRAKPNKTFQEQQTQELDRRLTAFQFSGKVELRNPVDGTPISKTGKDFLVQNSVRVFEDCRIWYPEADDMMRRQLLNYVVLRTTPTGKLIYGPENETLGDHRLDALMLSLAGLSLELGVFSSKQMVNSGVTSFSREELKARGEGPELSLGAKMMKRLGQAGGIAGGGALQLLEFQSDRPDKQPDGGIMRRSRGGVRGHDGDSVFEYFDRRAANTAGFPTDQEHEYQRDSMHVLRRRRSRRKTKKRGRR